RIERMREEDSCAAADHRLLRPGWLPCKADPRAEVSPVRRERRIRIAAYTEKLDHTGSPGGRIELLHVEAVHPVVLVDHRRIRLPTQAEVEGEIGTDGPVILREGAEIVAVAQQGLRLELAETGDEAGEHGGKAVAGGSVSGKASRLRREAEGAGDLTTE